MLIYACLQVLVNKKNHLKAIVLKKISPSFFCANKTSKQGFHTWMFTIYILVNTDQKITLSNIFTIIYLWQEIFSWNLSCKIWGSKSDYCWFASTSKVLHDQFKIKVLYWHIFYITILTMCNTRKQLFTFLKIVPLPRSVLTP